MRRYVTDGGVETDLIFHRGLDLPAFTLAGLGGAHRRSYRGEGA